MSKTIADLQLAVEWLTLNEGGNGEAEACARVADWLSAEIRARQEDAAIRLIRRQVPVSRSVARMALQRVQKQESSDA